MSDPNENVVVVEGVHEPIPAGQYWQPRVGPEGQGVINSKVPEHSRAPVQASAVSILGKCAPLVGQPQVETGLVVGYVQSGKTLSFTAVTALANDNDFQIVIVIAGTSVNLLRQSTGRLRRDLRLNEDRRRKWQQFTNPEDSDQYRRPIQNVLDDWRDATVPRQDRQTILITVMKQHQHLGNLIGLLSRINLDDVPVLVVDDEADQASLNTQISQGQQSTTYRRLMELRSVLPRHTLLEYTATPQAPLLISIIDTLSPNFVTVLEPGPDYVGGRDFFGDAASPYVHVIPPEEVPSPQQPLVEPPPTLIEAVRLFMVGVASGLLRNGNIGNRSMLVHPSHLTEFHADYCHWVTEIFENWKRILAEPGNSPDRVELLEDFRSAFDDLAATATDLPAFGEVAATLPRAFRLTEILPVNAAAGQTPEVPWSNAYGWILIGGQAMDRGFTVEGLTVTYMPRGLGVGNADTLQQRARFFGYKRPYLGYCRVYLEQTTLRAFQDYVQHEEDIRTQLQEFEGAGHRLKEWKRAFVLSPRLRPTRANVIQFDYVRGRFSDDWFQPRVVLVGAEVTEANREVVGRILASEIHFQDDDGHADRTPAMRHRVARQIHLSRVLDEFLIPMRITGAADAQRYIGLLLQLKRALDANPDEVCTIYQMSPNERRRRGVTEDGEIKNAFQGAAPVAPRELQGSIYPGDRRIHDDCVTVQIHHHDLTFPDEATVVATNVPFVAVWVPARLAAPWLVQEQPQA